MEIGIKSRVGPVIQATGHVNGIKKRRGFFFQTVRHFYRLFPSFG